MHMFLRSFGRFLPMLGLVGLVCWPCHGGGWPQKRGEGQVIVSGLVSSAGAGFDDDGALVDIDYFQKIEMSALLEYGASDRVTLLLKPVVQRYELGSAVRGEDFDLGATQLGVQYYLGSPWRGGVVSGQVLGVIPGGGETRDTDPLGDGGFGGEVRGLFGQSWAWGFGGVQLAWQDRAGGSEAKSMADVTLGVRVRPDVEVMAQSFATWTGALGDDASGVRDTRDAYFAQKVQLSVVGRANDAVALQVSGIATVAGRNALDERGGMVAIWLRY